MSPISVTFSSLYPGDSLPLQQGGCYYDQQAEKLKAILHFNAMIISNQKTPAESDIKTFPLGTSSLHMKCAAPDLEEVANVAILTTIPRK